MIEETLPMIPGPTPVHPRILDALARPTTSHQSPAFVETFRRCQANLLTIVQASSAQPFLVAGAGTLAMEMALVNLLGGDDRLLVVSQGFFGDRWAQLAEAYGRPCDTLSAEWGTVVAPEELAARLDGGGYAAVAVTHVDTSTGVRAPVADYGRVLAGRKELLLLDGVCATAGIDERFDEWGVDLLLTGAQKAFGTPPGLAILVASARAMERRRSIGSVPAYYTDLLRWQPVMDNPALYFSTPPVNLIVALSEATGMVLDEGLPVRFQRHRRLARATRAGLRACGLELFADEDCRAETLTVARHAAGVDDAKFRAAMASDGVVVAGALGPLAGRAFRIGHMGNIGPSEIYRTLDAVRTGLEAAAVATDPAAVIGAAACELAG